MEEEVNIDDALDQYLGIEPSSNSPISYEDYMADEDNGLLDNPFSINAEYEIEGDFEDSQFLNPWDDPRETEKIQDKMSSRQSWGHKAGAGVGRVGTKVLAEIAKMPGVIGGIAKGTAGQIGDLISGQDRTDFMQEAFNNPWIQAVTDAEEHIKEDFLPVHVKRAVTDGNLWDNITAIDFWATEGADGLGYIISMLAPGAAINKLGIGTKLMKSSGLTNMGAKSEKAATVLNKYGITAKNIDLHTGTVANTLFEAGAEAKGAMDSYEQSLQRRRLLHPENADYISDEKFEELMAKQSSVGAKVFTANAGILIGPNAIMSKMIWGNRLNKGKLAFKDGAFERLKKLTTKQGLIKAGNRFALGTAREGFFEEGMQSTAETYFTENPDAGGSEFIGDLADAYLNTVTSTEGQKAIFLGAIFGGTMQAVFEGKGENKRIKHQNKLIDRANEMLEQFDSFFSTDNELDENGNAIWADDVLKKRARAIEKKAGAIDQLEVMSMLYDEAVENGEESLVKDIREMMTTQLIKPFILNDELGIDALEQHLQASSALVAQSKKEKFDKDIYIKEILEKAKYLKDAHSTFSNFHDIMIDLKNKKATDSMKLEFINSLGSKYVGNKSHERYYSKQLEEVTASMEEELKQYNSSVKDIESNPAKLRDLGRHNTKLKQLGEAKAELTNIVRDALDINKNIWNEKVLNEKFDKFVAEEIAANKRQEDANAVQEISSKIHAATNLKDLEDIDIPEDKEYSPVLQKLKEEAFESLKKAQEAAEKEASETNTSNVEEEARKAAEIENQVEFVKNNYNVDEPIPTDGLDIEEGFEDAILKEVNENGITIENAKGEQLTLSLGDFHLVNYNTDDQFSNQDSDEVEEEIESVKPHQIKVNKDARIAITDNQENAKPLFPDLEEAHRFEQEPRNKEGFYGISINVAPGVTKGNSKAAKAYREYQKNGVTAENVGMLMDNLSININLSADVTAPLEIRPAKNKSHEVYDKTSAKLKEVIFLELLNGTPLSDIQIEVVGQYSGNIQLDVLDGKPAENNIADLYYFENISDVVKNVDNFYIVNDLGRLENTKGEELSTQRKLAKGEVYLAIPMANGKIFPLKLNSAKITETQADFLHDLYKTRFADFEHGKIKKEAEGKKAFLTEEQVTKFKTNFPQVFELFQEQGLQEEDIKIKDVIDFFVFDLSSNPKSRIRFNKGKIQVGEATFEEKDFDERKDEFIQHLTSIKRQHVRFKQRKQDIYNFTMTNPKYLEYLIRNGVLNTNAITKEPVFQGRTTMYVGTDTVTVKGEPSTYNDTTVEYRDNLFGANKGLKKVLGGLFELGLSLTTDSKAYKDTQGRIYERVSSLVPYTGNTSGNESANKRGNVIDLLIRDFFSPKQEIATLERFLDAGQNHVDEQNKLTKGDELIMDDVFLESVFNIFNHYAKVFNENEYTVYSDVPPVAFKLNDKYYAGTVDLLVFDNKNKVWKIIDLKTAVIDREDSYNRTDKFGYKGKDVVQQNAYREGFRQTAKVDIATLQILPITTAPARGKKGNYVGQKAKRTAVDFLDVDMTKDIYELKETTRQEFDGFDVTNYEEAPSQATDDETLGAFDSYFPEHFPEAGKAETKPEPKETKRKKVTDNMQSAEQFGAAQLQRGDWDSVNVNGVEYALTHAVVENGKVVNGLIAFTPQGPVTDKALYSKIVEAKNAYIDNPATRGYLGQLIKIGKNGQAAAFARITGTKAAEPSTTEAKKKKVAVKKEMVENTDFSSYTKEEATKAYKDLIKAGFIKPHIKAIGQLVKGKSPQDILKIVSKFLIEQGANKEEITKICKR